MKVVFVRHGKSIGNQYGVIQGHLDFNLSDDGRRQARSTAVEIKKLMRETKPIVFSSDLSRAWETAVIITEELGLNLPIPNRLLRERDMGILQDKHWTTIDWKQVNSQKPKINGLETRKKFQQRIDSFLRFVFANKQVIDKAIIVVTHGGTLKFIYSLLLGIDLDKVPYIDNAAIHMFNLTEEKGKIKGEYEGKK